MPGMEGTMREYAAGKLHSGSKHGPIVHSRAQAIAIGLSQARQRGEHVAPKPRRRKSLHRSISDALRD